MRPTRRSILTPLIFAAIAACLLSGCRAAPGRDRRFTIVSYNLMTLFDPVDQGGEYPGFSVAGGEWDERAYRQRIGALARAVLAVAPGGPDVLVVQEAENLRVLEDLSAALGGYRWILRSPAEDAPLGCGLLSRLPVTAARAHRASTAPRLMLEAELDAGGRTLVVLAAHWKSKLGGAAETEPVRIAGAALAGSVIAARLREDPGLAIVLAGDLNENPDEFSRAGGAYPTALLLRRGAPGEPGDTAAGSLAISFDPATVASGGYLSLWSPWGAGGWSYRFRGEPERIDHFILSPGLLGESGGLRFSSFSAEAPDCLLDASGNPMGWDGRHRSGYSDHLPIVLTLESAP